MLQLLIHCGSCRFVMSLIIVLMSTTVIIYGYPNFREKLPNGDRVPNPCTQEVGSVWRGVGHLVPEGGGNLNAFGADFKDNEYTWTRELCGLDSDGDGRTNGEELGDPDCVWTPEDDSIILRTHALSHPGICEPITSPECRDRTSWLDCQEITHKDCPIFNDPDTKRFEVSIPQIEVPEQDTTYICATVEAPDHIREGNYHVVGFQASIDNAQVLHHLEVSGCADEKVESVRKVYGSPRECQQGFELCTNRIYIWTFGLDSECLPPEYGFRIGANGYSTFLLEYHYNNGRHLSGQLDHSGAWLYYTEHLRPNDAMQMFVGATSLQVPPAQAHWEQAGTCCEQCMRRMFTEKAYIAKIMPHMHLLGLEIRVYLIGTDGTSQLLVEETDFKFKHQQHYVFDPPVEIQPGDALKVSCVYDSTRMESWTFYGYGTLEEMCSAGIQFYPKQEVEADCWDLGSNVSFCGVLSGREQIDECRSLFYGRTTKAELTANILDVFKQLNQFCDVTGRVCYTGCQSAIDLVKQHPCLSDNAYEYFASQHLMNVSVYHAEIRQALMSCSGIQYKAVSYKYDVNENDVMMIHVDHDVTPEKLVSSVAMKTSPTCGILAAVLLSLLSTRVISYITG